MLAAQNSDLFSLSVSQEELDFSEISAALIEQNSDVFSRSVSQEELDFDEISAALTVLNAVAAINQAVDAGDSQTSFHCLCDPQAHLPEVEEHMADAYQSTLAEHKMNKANTQVGAL